MNAKCRSCGGSGYIFFHTREEDDISHIDTHEEDSESLDNNEEEDGEEEGGEDEIIISAKGVMDGATTLDEAIEKFNEYINYLEELRNEGYELCDPIEGDQGFLQKM